MIVQSSSINEGSTDITFTIPETDLILAEKIIKKICTSNYIKNHIKDLMELRNIAAHANVNGMNKDIDETSIKKMKEKFSKLDDRNKLLLKMKN